MKVKKSSTRLDQLLQIAETPIADGDLISKSTTEELIEDMLVEEQSGFNFIKSDGVELLDRLDMIKR